jgi:PhnB protein
MAQLNPYLNFDKNCREAMNFYQDCLGGELVLQAVAEMPEMAARMPPEFAQLILHSTLKSGDIQIMASDLNREKQVEGNTIHLCINCDSETELTTFFSKLSVGGTVIDPLARMPWGAKFGTLKDRFGKNWIFNWQQA